MAHNKDENYNGQSHSCLYLLPPPAVAADLVAGLLDLDEGEDVHGDQDDEGHHVQQHQAQQ